MPLLLPNQLNNVLQALPGREKKETSKSTLKDLLESSSLGEEEVLDVLGTLMRGADTSAVRLQAAKTAMQLHGMLSGDEGVKIPVVNIVIRDSEFTLNPILIPR